MSHYKPYPAYRDSGVEWIGEVPEHWRHSKVAWDMKMTIGWTPPTGNRSYYGGPHNWVSIADLSSGRISETKQTLTDAAIAEMRGTQAPEGSLLFSYKLSIGEVALLERPAYTNEAIAAFHPCQRVYMPFWKYAAPIILPRYSRMNIYGSDLLNQELMNSARMAIPDVSEQQVIANAVDRETARIDALITKKTRFIELLKEKRQALITHAVTKGLDPNVKMKDSGVEWIGEVPEHWVIGRLCDFCSSISTGPFGTALGVSDYIEDGIPVINPSHMNDGLCAPDRLVTVSDETAQRLAFWALREGDIVAARRGELGRAAIVTGKEAGWICGTGSLRLTPLPERAVPEYLYSVLQSDYARAWLDRESVGSTMPNLNESLIGRLPVVIPPSTTEQIALLSSLDQQECRVASLITKTQRSIDLLKERRAAFVTAAVTGQIDLRESA